MRSRDTGDRRRERERENKNFYLNPLWGSERKKETKGERERERWRKRGFLLKGDNKEPLEEQMKMSFPPSHLSLLCPVEG